MTTWESKSWLQKSITVAAVVLCVSLGLCGANFVAVFNYVPLSEGASRHDWHYHLGQVLAVTGYIELFAIAMSLISLVVLGSAILLSQSKSDKDQA